MFRIGIVGKGFVGAAVAHGFSQGVGYDAEIRVHDKDPSKSQNTLEEVVTESDFVFISVPTPSNKDGSIDYKEFKDFVSNSVKISLKKVTKDCGDNE